MHENSRYAVGIDIGTTTIRCVVGHIDADTGTPTIVGVGKAPNSGMRKGIVANLSGPAEAIDKALGEAERMSGYEVNEAMISVNGAHIISTKADGMVAVGTAQHEVTHEDLDRVEEVATVGKLAANREVLEVVPHSFRLDGQDNIKDPIGMTGTRLEISANIISALEPHVANVQKTAEMATVYARGVAPSVLASARAVLSESQMESGVAVVDMGGSTTSVAVFEEGDLQYVGVVPMGGINVTNDLAIGLKTDPEVAEEVKLKHASAVARSDKEGVSVKQDKEVLTFDTGDIDEIVEARLEEIFELVQKELKKAGRAGQLPSGVVLTGGAAEMTHMVEFVREKLGLSARLGKPTGFGGVNEEVAVPSFAAAVGLMLHDTDSPQKKSSRGGGHVNAKSAGASAVKSGVGVVKNLFNKFKS